MRIATYVPDLTAKEAERFWLTPVELCRLATVDAWDEPRLKKLLNTLSDREHVPFVKSGTAKTAARLYSLKSAAMLRVFWDVTRDGRTYVYSEPVAMAVAAELLRAVQEFRFVSDYEGQHGTDRIVFEDITEAGTARFLNWHRQHEPAHGRLLCRSVYDAGHLVYRLCEGYADFWAADLAKREAA